MPPRSIAALLLLLLVVAAAAVSTSAAAPAPSPPPNPTASSVPKNSKPPVADKPAAKPAASAAADATKREPARKPNPITGPRAAAAAAAAPSPPAARAANAAKPSTTPKPEPRKPNPITGPRAAAAKAPAPAPKATAAPAKNAAPAAPAPKDAAAATAALAAAVRARNNTNAANAAPKVQALDAPAPAAPATDPLAGARLGDPNTGGWRPGRATFVSVQDFRLAVEAGRSFGRSLTPPPPKKKTPNPPRKKKPRKFGAPNAFAKRYDPTRGDGSFGVLEYGACGYTDLLRDGKSVAPSFPRSEFAAVADVSPEHLGGCGRCYEVRCKNTDEKGGTPVLNNEGQPISLRTVGDATSHNQSVRYFEGDFGRPVLEDIDPTVRDSQNRPFPGNSASASNGMRVKCFPGAPSVRVRLADSCPCRQVLKAGDPTAKSDGEVRRQQWCCGGSGVSTVDSDKPFEGLTHFDLSYDAFEKLAHPVYGVQMIEFRPVDCDSGKPLPSRVANQPVPYVDRRTIYGDTGIRPGWLWFPYSKNRAELIRKGAFPAGAGNKEAAAATCVELTRGGGLTFECRDCGGRLGLQPFSPATYGPGGGGAGGRRDAVVFWLALDGGDAKKAPNLKVFLRNTNAGQDKGYCRNAIFTSQLPVFEERAGGWRRYVVPLQMLGCDYPGATLQDVNRLEFQNEGEMPVPFCLAQVGLA
jgi:cullin-associated NEDD8-dissociated protein 1